MKEGFLDRIKNGIELFLVKWGWLIFPLGITGIWLPFKWLAPVVLFALFSCLWLMLMQIVRFIAHASICFEQKQPGKASMFLVLMLPSMALFIWSSIAEGFSSWRIPANWQNIAITSLFGYMTLLVIGLRWWYVSGEALRFERKGR